MTTAFVGVPIITAVVATARLNPDADCCFGRGIPVAAMMLCSSFFAGFALFWPGIAFVRSSNGGKLSKVHRFVFVAIGIGVFVVLPVFVGSLLEGNL